MSQIEVVHILPTLQKVPKRSTKTKHSYAPFLSTVNKSIEKKKATSPGPGHYGRQLSRIIDRNSYQISSNSPENERSAVFRDESSRFKILKVNSPGPAHYSPDTMRREQSKKKLGNALDQYRIKFPEMYGHDKSVSIQSYTKPRKQGLEKSAEKVLERQLKGTDWSKSKQQRFKSQFDDKEGIPGPGFYYLPTNVKEETKAGKYLSPQFLSSSPRSFMDSIIYQYNSESKHIPYNVYKKDEPGPGSYNLDSQFHMLRLASNSRLLPNQERNRSTRPKRVKLNNLSSQMTKSSSYNNIEPMLKIRQLHPLS